jgi:hypothetical protein
MEHSHHPFILPRTTKPLAFEGKETPRIFIPNRSPVPVGIPPLRAAVGKAHGQHGRRCVSIGCVNVQPIIFWELVRLHASDEPGQEGPLPFHGANKLLKLAVV